MRFVSFPFLVFCFAAFFGASFLPSFFSYKNVFAASAPIQCLLPPAIPDELNLDIDISRFVHLDGGGRGGGSGDCPRKGWTGNPPQAIIDAQKTLKKYAEREYPNDERSSPEFIRCAQCMIKAIANHESIGFKWNAFGTARDRGMWQYIWSTWVGTVGENQNYIGQDVCPSPVVGKMIGLECKDADVKEDEPSLRRALESADKACNLLKGKKEANDLRIWDPYAQMVHVITYLVKNKSGRQWYACEKALADCKRARACGGGVTFGC